MESKTLKSAQSTLADIGRTYHPVIPLNDVFAACRSAGLEPVQEDGTPWSGFLCGSQGRATIELAGSKRCLQLTWYRMGTGRYEVIAYIS